jgi:hypothetical protein
MIGLREHFNRSKLAMKAPCPYTEDRQDCHPGRETAES